MLQPASRFPSALLGRCDAVRGPDVKLNLSRRCQLCSDRGNTLSDLYDEPFLVFLFSLVILWLAVRAGSFLAGKLRHPTPDEREDINVVISACLTLLALIIGFTFSMAVGRYDQRKNYEEEEANAIGTEYVRADLLSVADGERVRQLLKEFLAQRILFYTVRDPQQLEAIDGKTTQLENDLWSVVQDAVKTGQPTPVLALVVAGMNDVLNRQGYTQAAWWNRIPVSAWTLMITLAVFCSAMIGYAQHQRRVWLFAVVPLLVSIAFFLIADIDSPRRGVIRVIPQNLDSLSQSLRSH